MKNFMAIGTALFIFCIGIVGIKLSLANIPIQDTDAEILSMLAVIDQNEIQAAKVAEKKHINASVLGYAKMLDQDHANNLDQVRKISQRLGVRLLEDRDGSGKLRKEGEEEMAALSPLDQDNFSRMFISDMIKGHSDVMAWIDSQDSQNGHIKKFLNETGKHISMHLKKAQEIQEQLSKQ